MVAIWNAQKAKKLSFKDQKPRFYLCHTHWVFQGRLSPRLGYRWLTFPITEADSGFADLSLQSRGKVVQQEPILGYHTIKLM